MRKLALLVLIVATLAACTRRNAEPVVQLRSSGEQHQILVFGDSLALGTGASDPGRGFTFLLYRDFLQRDPGAQITSFAVGGAGVTDVLHYELARADDRTATDVWICVGGNDVTRSTQPDRFAAEESAVVGAARHRWPAAKIVVFGVPDVSRSPLFFGVARLELRHLAELDNGAARDAAAEHRAVFVDLFALGKRVDPQRDFSADNFHPNDSGYEAIANFSRRAVVSDN